VRAVRVDYDVYRLLGGLDQTTPTTSLPPGVARGALNFEVAITGGYARIAGYERTDGRVGAPSEATFSAFTLDNASAIAVGDALDNGSGETGTAIAVVGNTVFYTQQVGAFAVSDTLTTGQVITALGSGLLTSQQRAAYTLAAANVYRALIGPVPGSGDIRGVAYMSGVLYAWRDNAGATLLEMYKATTSGWTKIIFGYEVSFTTGSVSPVIGVAIVQGVVSAVTRAISLESGSWGAGTAAGRFIVDAPSGGAFIAGALTGGGTAVLNAGLSGGLVQAVIAFLPGGRVQTDTANFGAGTTRKLYGCDNENRGFEFDGTTMVPIKTGMTVDRPTNVKVHKNHLFFSFGASLQSSAISTPYAWTPLLGAGEYLANDDIKAIASLPGNETVGALGVYTPNSTFILYGTSFGSGGNAQLVEFNGGSGCESYTAQVLDQTYALDATGIANMAVTQRFGNFLSNSITANILPFIRTHRGTATASGVNRERSQYRVFYANGDALYLTMSNGKPLGVMPVTFPNPVTCWCEGPNDENVEIGFFGSTEDALGDAYVYQMDIGPNFDGATMPFMLQLNFNSIRSPRVLKRYRKAALEIKSSNQADFSVGYQVGYGDSTAKQQPPLTTAQVPFAGAIPYDAGYTYDSGQFYDGRSLGPVEVELQGSAENISFQVVGTTAIYSPFTINTVTIHYTPRRGLR